MTESKTQLMAWLKKHADTIATLISILSAVLWMSGKFSNIDVKFANIDTKFVKIEKDVQQKFAALEKDFDQKFSALEKDIAIIKTVLLMKEVLPKELCTTHTE